MTVRRVTPSERRRRRGPKRWVIVKDVATFGLGWGLIYQQALSGREPSWPLLLIVAVLLGVPGGSEILSRLTGSSASASPSEPSPGSSSSSSGFDDETRE